MFHSGIGEAGRTESTMRRTHTVAHRWMCLLILMILILAGVRMEELHADSCSVYPDFAKASIQRVSGGQADVLYSDSRTLSQLEHFNAYRSGSRFLTGMRPGQWMAVFLIPAAMFLKLLTREIFLPLCEACENQYGRRTLKFIHQKDGKKA